MVVCSLDILNIVRRVKQVHQSWQPRFKFCFPEPLLIMVQGSPFIMLCLGSIELDRVISEPCYKGII